MSLENKNKPAFPIQPTFDDAGRICNESYAFGEGLTKREYFAGMALQALLSNGTISVNKIQTTAMEAVWFADALLKELEIKSETPQKH